MNSLEILKTLLLIPYHTVGVFPADKIIEKWTKPCAFVFNTDLHTQPGAHWVAVYVDKNANAWYFDSYGLPPFVRHHLRAIRKNCRCLRWNTRQLQSTNSAVCGQFCILFLHFLSTAGTMNQFIIIFSDDLHKNDRISAEYVKKMCKKVRNSRLSHMGGGGKLCRLHPTQQSICQQDFRCLSRNLLTLV